MNKQDCRVGMVVYHREFQVKGVVVKCNPKKARVRTVEDMKGTSRSGSRAGTLWNMPYSGLDPVLDVKTEMAMRGFEQTDNQGIKTYFQHASAADQPVECSEGSPEHHVMMAVCELWRRLDDDRIRAEVDAMDATPSSKAAKFRNRKAHLSEQINKLFTFLDREVSREAAERWETGKIVDNEVSTP